MKKKLFLISLFLIKLNYLFCSETQDLSSCSSSSSVSSTSTSISSPSISNISHNKSIFTAWQDLVLFELNKNTNLPLDITKLIVSLSPKYNEQATTKLFEAINFDSTLNIQEKIAKLKDAINNNVDVCAFDRCSLTPIDYILGTCDLEFMKLLAEVNEERVKNYALLKTIYYNIHCHQTSSIFSPNNRKKLFMRIVELLLQKGADPNIMISRDSVYIEGSLLKPKQPILVYAALFDDIELITLLLKYKADPAIKSLFSDNENRITLGESFIDLAKKKTELQKILDESSII